MSPASARNFSFKCEAVWIIIFSLGPGAIGLLVVLILWLIGKAELILR
jgi:hypothetical protein